MMKITGDDNNDDNDSAGHSNVFNDRMKESAIN